MKANWWMRFVFLLCVVVASVMTVIPTVFDFPEESSYPIKSKVNFGLDLQGGLYMVLGINFHEVYRDEVKGMAQKFVKLVQAEGNNKGVDITAEVGDLDLTNPADPQITLLFGSEDDSQKAKDLIKEYYRRQMRVTKDQEKSFSFGLSSYIKNDIETQSMGRSIEVIRNRVDEFGVTEPEIVPQGKSRIVVQLAGVSDIKRAKELIGKTAKLEFRMVNSDVTQNQVNEWVEKGKKSGIIYGEGKHTRYSDYLHNLNEFLKKDVPKGYELAFEKKISKLTNEVLSITPYLIQDSGTIQGDDLQDASPRFDPSQQKVQVSLTLKTHAAKKFEELTGENVGKRLAIVLDGSVYSAPVINQRIPGGMASIGMGGQQDQQKAFQEAKDLSMVLRAGALPVRLNFEEQRIVGPSLGNDSIEDAQTAGLIGCVAVFLFMVLYYRVSGVFAMCILGINVLIIVACLVGVGATLTLPGIAGIALTVGMAVDATIIIYERIREEIRKGNNFFRSVESGFAHAFWTILDANITTALAGFCLLNFGTGPIKGFAVTLLIGIMATVYSAYFVGKLLFEGYQHMVSGKDLSI